MKKFIFSILVPIFFISSCTQEKIQYTGINIPLKKELKGRVLNTTFIFSSPQEMIIVDSLLIVHDSHNRDTCFHIFNKINGKHIGSFGNKGRGPGEYLRIESIDINTEKEELMLVDGMSDKLFFYDLDGNFKSIHSIRYFQTENTLCLRDSVFLHISAPSQNFGNEGLYGYALVLSKGNENFLKGYRYLPLQVGYKGGGQIFKGYERSCYHPIYSDTIYQILSDTTYGPIFYFKIKNSSWEKYHNSDRFVDIDGSEEGVFTLLYENQDFFLGYIADKKKKGNYMQPFLYDKMKDKTYLLRWCDYYEHLKELDYFEGYEARGIFEDYFIAHVSFSTLDQYNIFERVKDGALKITNPELERVIQNLNTDSNPVLILTKFKHL